jgi:GNAT superfamily N-acetyltransferase
MSHTYQNGPFVVSTDPIRLDIDLIHTFLAAESYWARGIDRATVVRACRHSLCFGLFDGQAQIGFARVISDYATYAYLNDVFILEAYRGKGLGQWLMECVMAHPDLQGLRRFALTTRDAQGLYAQFGFGPLHYPDRHMERLPPDYYTRAS